LLFLHWYNDAERGFYAAYSTTAASERLSAKTSDYHAKTGGVGYQKKLILKIYSMLIYNE
jgi:hypothetical protein